MDVNKVMLSRLFEGAERFEAPLFQRPYVWTMRQNWEPLWESIQTLADKRLTGIPVRPHFLGTIVLDQLRTSPGRILARQIIDGQQRLTTMQLALAATRDIAAAEAFQDYENALSLLTRNAAPLSRCEEDVFKVWPTNADREDFAAVMTAGSQVAVRKQPHATIEDAWLIPNAYLYFYERFNEWIFSNDLATRRVRLEALYYTFVESLQFVVISLEEKDDAQEIFETLNALGTPLLPADLVKNYLFRQALERDEKEDANGLYKRYWKTFDTERGYWRQQVRQGRLNRPRIDLFLFHYLTLMHGEVILDSQIFDSFKRLFREKLESSPTAHMAQFTEYASVACMFDRFARNSREEWFFHRLREMDVGTLHPLMLEVCKRYSGDEHAAERHQIMCDLESYLFRRIICRMSSKSYNRFFSELIQRLWKENDFSPSTIRVLLASEVSDSTVWPTDAMFCEAWHTLPVYRCLSKKNTRIILEAIEDGLYDEKSGRVDFERSLTIEHLMPQEPRSGDWPLPCNQNDPVAVEEAIKRRQRLLHTIGNLTLITQKLNSTVSNGPWSKKSGEILMHSPLRLNRPFKDVNEWTEGHIEQRTDELFRDVLRLWPRPEGHVIDEQRQAIRPARRSSEDRHRLRKLFWTELLRYAETKTSLHANRKPGMYNWIGGAIGRRGFSINYGVREHESQIELYIDFGKEHARENQKAFAALLEKKEEIEKVFGESLEWQELPEKRACRICKVFKGGWRSPQAEWAETHAELVDAMIRLDKSLRDHVQNLRM